LLNEIDLEGYNPRAPAINSRAKTRAAEASKSLTQLNREEILQRILDRLDLIVNESQPPSEGKPHTRRSRLALTPAIAWDTASWSLFVGTNGGNAMAEQNDLQAHLERAGWQVQRTQMKTGHGTNHVRVWTISKKIWSDLTTVEKRAALAAGEGDMENFECPTAEI
jgi:hypothetical protein